MTLGASIKTTRRAGRLRVGANGLACHELFGCDATRAISKSHRVASSMPQPEGSGTGCGVSAGAGRPGEPSSFC
jgi:hypothetical protein